MFLILEPQRQRCSLLKARVRSLSFSQPLAQHHAAHLPTQNCRNFSLKLRTPSYRITAGAGIDSGVMWAGQYSCDSKVDPNPHKNL